MNDGAKVRNNLIVFRFPSPRAPASNKQYLGGMSVHKYFSEMVGPRVMGHCKHKLSDILIIALANCFCGGEDYKIDVRTLLGARLVSAPTG